jgi:uncharacterized membrane protein
MQFSVANFFEDSLVLTISTISTYFFDMAFSSVVADHFEMIFSAFFTNHFIFGDSLSFAFFLVIAHLFLAMIAFHIFTNFAVSANLFFNFSLFDDISFVFFG